ncbi:hypothetical protein [Candidatus Venteria ishoeyi]|uniref:Uncharacterized protein n=1 Tax=Candidatus Venteria ishoeyi TaxID=1899563 RepID=A0A1H6FFP2_9GAMM|nr:hypothetical protein [Candidatus Venteria ishoeyi]SEH08890.1 Uncharacterised protein [Candidatus Venteria ishoeyi]
MKILSLKNLMLTAIFIPLNAYALDINIKPALEQANVAGQLKSIIRSKPYAHNSVTVKLRSAIVHLVKKGNPKAKVHVWVQNKQNTCFLGNCTSLTGFYTNFAVHFEVGNQCSIRHFHLSKWGTRCWGPDCAVTAVGHELLKLFRGRIHGMLQQAIKQELKGRVPGC